MICGYRRASRNTNDATGNRLFCATSRLTHLAPAHQWLGIAFWIGFSINALAIEIWLRTRAVPLAYRWRRRLTLHQPLNMLHELVKGNRTLIAFTSGATLTGPASASLSPMTAHRHLFHGEIANLGVHLFVASIEFHAKAIFCNCRCIFLAYS